MRYVLLSPRRELLADGDTFESMLVRLHEIHTHTSGFVFPVLVPEIGCIARGYVPNAISFKVDDKEGFYVIKRLG